MMGIYFISWDSSGFGLSAVVIAKDEKEAVAMLELNDESIVDMSVIKIGTATSEHDIEPRVVIQESL